MPPRKLASLIAKTSLLLAAGRLILRLREYAAASAACRKEARDSKGTLDAVVNALGDPVFVKDRRHRWVMLNDALCRFMGYPREQLLGKSDTDFFPPEQSRVFWEKDDKVFATGEEDLNEEYFTDAKGRTHVISTRKALYTDASGERFIVGVIRDITDQRQAEERLRQSQKLEAVGRLASGFAHDFGNMLSAVVGTAELVLADLRPGDPHEEDLRIIRDASQKAAGMVRQLMVLGRRQALRLEPLCVNEMVRGLERVLRRLSGDRIALELRLADGLWAVRSDRGRIEQVVLNLVVNARDAMPEGGRLLVETRNERLDAGRAAELGLSAGDYVALAVRDTGVGMTDEVRERIFEPFYTTKPSGMGTGLGLAVVYGIAKQSGGCVRVDSRPGEGSVFTLYLPKCEEPERAPRAPPLERAGEPR